MRIVRAHGASSFGLAGRHTKEVIGPFLESLRGKVALVLFSLPGDEDPIRKKLYRSFRAKPSESERKQGAKELHAKLNGFVYRGEPLPGKLTLSEDRPVVDAQHGLRNILREAAEPRS